MQTLKQRLDDIRTTYPLDTIGSMEEILFIDIETTGFSATSSYLYMIGCLYYENHSFHVIQWFADTYEEEEQILNSFFRFSQPYRYLIHYNGAQFDLPYIMKKVEKKHLPYTFDAFESIDVYKRIAPYKQLLSLENLKQKSIETFLSLKREDLYNGGQLISIYHDYVKSPTEYNRELLLLHNFEDVKGMLQILPILSYYDLFNAGITCEHAEINFYEDVYGKSQKELLLTCTSSHALPVGFSYSKNDCRIMAEGTEVKLRVPLVHAELKYFLPNYKEYYYLPLEDTAIHKSVAAYVDHAHRIPATLATCYTKKEGDFLPQWNACFSPEFKPEYRNRSSYFLYEDAFLTDQEMLDRYSNELLQMFAQK